MSFLRIGLTQAPKYVEILPVRVKIHTALRFVFLMKGIMLVTVYYSTDIDVQNGPVRIHRFSYETIFYASNLHLK